MARGRRLADIVGADNPYEGVDPSRRYSRRQVAGIESRARGVASAARGAAATGRSGGFRRADLVRDFIRSSQSYAKARASGDLRASREALKVVRSAHAQLHPDDKVAAIKGARRSLRGKVGERREVPSRRGLAAVATW